jgi:virulence factor
MPDRAKLRIALIGLGKIAQKAYLPLLTNHADVDPILCTRNPQILARLAQQYRITKVYSDLDELIRTRPDGAMVHSATDSHPQLVAKLLAAGIPVFVDKPLSYSLEESEKLLNLAAKMKRPLYLGFNRRFAPLVPSLTSASHPIQISWQKNRVDLPDDPRIFIFDDFIHVVDSLRFLAQGPIRNLRVVSRINDQQLENIQVQWQQQETLLQGGMNRVSGVSEERIEYYTKGNKWLLNDLNSGIHFTEEEQTALQFDNWATTLHKRGFVNMIADWISVVRAGSFNPAALEDIWETHHLCETIVNEAGGS